MNRRVATAVFAAGLLTSAGCLSPRNARVPSLLPRGTAAERAEARFHDPFPRDDVGPDTSMRPPGFAIPRDGVRALRERTGAAGFRQQYGRPTPPVLPLGMRPGYGSAVR